MNKTNRPSVVARDKQFIAGITKRLQNVPTLAIAGATYSPADLIKLFQSQIDAVDAANAAQAKAKDAMQAYKDLSRRLVPVIGGFRTQVRNLFGNQSEALGDFGLDVIKTSKPKLDTKVEAVAKRKATRTARHTMGTKQREGVTGAPASPAPPAKPTA